MDISYQSWAELQEPRPALLITGRSMQSATEAMRGVNVVASETLIPGAEGEVPRRAAIHVETVIGIGGGSVMDAAKLRGWQLGVEVTCIPALLSTDAFLTTCAAVRDDGRVRYVPTGSATRVVIDFEQIRRAPARLNALGCADVLSTLTASHDWQSASDVPAAGRAAEEAAAICDRLLAEAGSIAEGSPTGLAAILRGLEAEVELCTRYGTDSIEEGGEHFFAYALEQRAPRLMHGALVGFGILAVRHLQGHSINDLRRFFAVTGVASHWGSITADVLAETFQEMASFVECGGYPYSVWNTAHLDRATAAGLARTVLEGALS